MTTYAERVAARLAGCDSPDGRRMAALAAIKVAVNPALDLPDAEIVADVRAVLAALKEASRPVSS